MKRKRLPPKPPANPNGMYILHPDTGKEYYMPFKVLEQMCQEIMAPHNAEAVESELGKMDWRNDPTYNLQRKRI